MDYPVPSPVLFGLKERGGTPLRVERHVNTAADKSSIVILRVGAERPQIHQIIE